MTTVLSGSRPIVAITPAANSFNTRFSNCRISLAIMPSGGVSAPASRKAPPPTVRDFYDHHGDVVCPAVTVGGINQSVTNALRIPQLRDRVCQCGVRHHARQPVAAEQQIVAGLH